MSVGRHAWSVVIASQRVGDEQDPRRRAGCARPRAGPGSRRRPSARDGGAPTSRRRRRRASRASHGRSADGARPHAAPVVERAGLLQELVGQSELADVAHVGSQPDELDVLDRKAHAGCDPRGRLPDPRPLEPACVHGAARGRRQPRRTRARSAPAARGSAVRPAPGSYAQTQSLPPCFARYSPWSAARIRPPLGMPLAGIDGDARRDRHRPAVLELDRRDPGEHRLGDRDPVRLAVPGQEQRELVSADPEALAAGAQAARDPGEHLVAGRMAVAVVDRLEVVDVEEDDRDRRADRVGTVERMLEPLEEVPRVAETGERIGQRETRRLARSTGADEQVPAREQCRRGPPRGRRTRPARVPRPRRPRAPRLPQQGRRARRSSTAARVRRPGDTARWREIVSVHQRRSGTSDRSMDAPGGLIIARSRERAARVDPPIEGRWARSATCAGHESPASASGRRPQAKRSA